MKLANAFIFSRRACRRGKNHGTADAAAGRPRNHRPEKALMRVSEMYEDIYLEAYDDAYDWFRVADQNFDQGWADAIEGREFKPIGFEEAYGSGYRLGRKDREGAQAKMLRDLHEHQLLEREWQEAEREIDEMER